MKFRFLFLLAGAFLLGGSLWAADEETPDRETLEKQDLAALKGTWVPVSAERNGGEKPSAAFLKSFKMEFDEENKKVIVTIGGQKKTATIESIDPTSKPKELDLRADGVTSPIIYELDKGMLKIVIDSKDTTRAKEFKTVKGGTHILLVLKKQ
jgi:uncharacterized protein (TIGR03067 family)